MKQFLLAMIVGAGGLLVASLAIINLATDGDHVTAVAGETEAAAVARSAGASAAESARAPSAAPSAETWVPVPVTDPVVSRTADGALTPATHRERISFRQEMVRGVASLGTLVARCPLGDGALQLDLQTVEGGITVVDARAEPGSTTTAAGVECARSALRGKTIPAPSAEPGKRWQMPFNPRS